MDGVGGSAEKVVVVVASSPSLNVLDAAVYRPGRLDVHVQLTHPSLEESAAAMAERVVSFVCHPRHQGSTRPRCFSKVEEMAESAVTALRQSVQTRALKYLTTSGSFSPADAMAAVRDVILHVGEQMTVDMEAINGAFDAINKQR